VAQVELVQQVLVVELEDIEKVQLHLPKDKNTQSQSVEAVVEVDNMVVQVLMVVQVQYPMQQLVKEFL
jgi:hypothetical protein